MRWPKQEETPLRTTFLSAALALVGGLLFASQPLPVSAQDPAPLLDFEDLMDSAFDPESGTLTLGAYDLADPPEGKISLQVGVIDPSGELIGHYPATEMPDARRERLTRMLVRSPAKVRLGKAGVYAVVFQHERTPITRFQFNLREKRDGGGGFGPGGRFALDGHWRSLAHVTRRDLDGLSVPVITFWLGGNDLPKTHQDEGRFLLELRRNGQLVAQSKRSAGRFFDGPYKRSEAELFHPHDPYAEAGARRFTLPELLVDAAYEVRVSRVPDRTQVRRFKFQVSGGAIVPHPRARPDHEPAMGRISPWVTRGLPGAERLIEATWIGTR